MVRFCRAADEAEVTTSIPLASYFLRSKSSRSEDKRVVLALVNGDRER